MHDERYVHVRQRAEAYEAWYEKERVCAHIAGNCREEAEKILAQADRLMAHTFSFEDRWDMEPCSEPFTLKAQRGSGMDFHAESSRVHE